MALKFGPQWLRDLSDGGTGGPTQPPTPTLGGKFKLAEYRYGREEMLALYNDSSPPPDQVRKHQSIFSKENQKPIAMSPLTEDEQHLMSQGFNSTVVLRVATRGSAPPLRGRGGAITADRGRGRGRGRGEGYISRTLENGEPAYGRSTQDGWEHVGRKFERSFSRGYDDPSLSKREYSRSSSDNWRDKRPEEEKEDGGWRGPHRDTRENTRWGPSPSSRPSWREGRDQSDYIGYEDRRPPLKYRDSEQDSRGPRRISETHENDDMPEWVGDYEIEDDPGTFDSSGQFVPSRTGRQDGGIQNKPKAHTEHRESIEEDKGDGRRRLNHSRSLEKRPDGRGDPPEEMPAPLKRHNGTDGMLDVRKPPIPTSEPASAKEPLSDRRSNKQPVEPDGRGGGISKPVESRGSPGGSPTHLRNMDTQSQQSSVPKPETLAMPSLPTPTAAARPDQNFLHMEKSLQNLIAEMTVNSVKKAEAQTDVAKGALPLSHENANKWFYRDPQGEIQGPFKSEDMAQWFSAGYFAMSLIVKRGCDDSFKQLGELIKRYGRVPFLPGPPLPPLITSNPSPEEVPTVTSAPAMTMPSMVPQLMPVQSINDPIVFQQFLAQQEYIKQQSFLMQQMQIQTLSKLQEQESFKMLSPEQQQHLTMQMMMQTNPLFMQQFQQLQHQMLLQQQQQQLSSQQHQPPLPSVQPPQVPQSSASESLPDSGVGSFGPQLSHPSTNMTLPPSASFAAATTPTKTPDGSDNNGNGAGSVWGVKQAAPPASNSWPQSSSMWDIDDDNSTDSAQKNEPEDQQRLQEEERIRQKEIENRSKELRRQQEEIEKQRVQVRKEKEELERQKQLELQKQEEVRRLEEERHMQEIERQKREQAERERALLAEEKKRLEEERKREKELKKQEEKRRKEEEKHRRLQEELQREQEELRQKREEEILRQQELERETKRQEEFQRQIELEQMREEEERIERETREKEAQKKQQQEFKRQQESLRKLQQQQNEKLANMQLPASSNWAKQQSSAQGGPVQSKSLTEIQKEEAQSEREKEREQHAQIQMMQAQVAVMQQQNHQKSWATHASQGIANRGLSLLDIQQQEQENAKKTQKEKERSQNYQAKLSQNINSTWSGNHSGLWGSQAVWDNSNAVSNLGPWDSAVTTPSPRKNQSSKESSEFPALKNPSQQAKKNAKSTKKAVVSKQKKEEETVQKLFSVRQQQDGFTQWVTDRVSLFSAQIDVPTFVSFIVEVDSPDDVRDYVKTYLGETKECKDFARQFVEKRSQFRNQARLEKQLEEDSIWGPAPAINPRSLSSGVNNSTMVGGDGDKAKAKAAKKKKQKMQKLDGSVLGFTVHADPNRKNAAGEFESVQ